jgi:sigma-B regulation protein RsbU (phosphoserine phosphatase)
VSGHGVGSPLLAVSAASLLSAGPLPDTDFRGPGAVVARPNDVFQTKLQSGKYFTIFYGVYNCATRPLA